MRCCCGVAQCSGVVEIALFEKASGDAYSKVAHFFFGVSVVSVDSVAWCYPCGAISLGMGLWWRASLRQNNGLWGAPDKRSHFKVW